MAGDTLTAFPATERAYREAVAVRQVDRASFDRPLARCDLARCRGSCCATGVAVNDETAAVLRRLVARERDWFRSIGIDLPDDVIASPPEAIALGQGRTALAPRQFHGTVDGFADHFPDAACVFLLGDGRCSLQVLSVVRGHHPWYFKPMPCWLHPIIVSDEAVTVPDEQADHLPGHEGEGFVTSTLCGRTSACGRP